jgi:hypothetical protein
VTQVAFGLDGSGDTEYGIVVAEATSSGSLDGGYILSVTYPLVNSPSPPSNVQLVVLETYHDYYVPLGITTTAIPLKF